MGILARRLEGDQSSGYPRRRLRRAGGRNGARERHQPRHRIPAVMFAAFGAPANLDVQIDERLFGRGAIAQNLQHQAEGERGALVVEGAARLEIAVAHTVHPGLPASGAWAVEELRNHGGGC